MQPISEHIHIYACNCDVFSVINVYPDHLKLCFVCINVVVNVMLSLMSVMSPSPALCNLSLCTVVKLCTLGVLTLGVNCDDICMSGANKKFELLEFVFESVYVDLQYDEISLTFTAGSVCLCGVCSLSVRLSWYPILWVRLLR